MNFEDQYARHFRMVWNLCCTYLKHPADAEDAVQEVFLRLALSKKQFLSHDHERAWLITTAKNVCRDELKRARRRELPLAEHDAPLPHPEPDETLEALRALPEKYRTALYLHYYEDLPTAQIAQLLHRRESTIRSDLRRGRLLLKKELEGER